MGGERNLERLLATMEPELRPGTFVYAVVPDKQQLGLLAPELTVREDEGWTAVVPRDRADTIGLAYEYEAAWITLRVHSALEAVGLTAAVSTALADAGLSCIVVAGYHHDHLLVPADRAQEALAVLSELSLAAVRRQPR